MEWIIILAGFAVIYVIATKLGNYDSDNADKTLNSDDSEKFVSPMPYGEHTTSEIAVRGNIVVGDIVVMKPSIWYGVFIFGCGLIGLIISLIYFDVYAWIGVMVFGVIGIDTLIAPFTINFILDNNGITTKRDIRLWRFTIYKNSTLTHWSVFSHVTYISAHFSGTGFYLHYTKPRGKTRSLFGGRRAFSIRFGQDNYKEALEYAVRKIPKDKFRENAIDKLKRMGIWEGKQE